MDRNEKSLWRKTFNLRGNTENEKSQRRQRSKRIVKTFSPSFPREIFHTKPSSKRFFYIGKYWLLTIHRRKLFSRLSKESISVGGIVYEGVKRGFASLQGKKGLTRREKKDAMLRRLCWCAATDAAESKRRLKRKNLHSNMCSIKAWVNAVWWPKITLKDRASWKVLKASRWKIFTRSTKSLQRVWISN